MKIPVIKHIYPIVFICVFLLSGCGYTTRSLLPSDIKTIRIDNFKNDIRITAEQSNLRMYRGYRPGMEIELTKTVINKFLSDGTLRIANESSADLILRGELVDYRREALRYDTNDNIEEYRIKLLVNLELINTKTGNVMWTERGFAGETAYYPGGAMAKSEAAALKDAIDDLSRRIVERTIEAW